MRRLKNKHTAIIVGMLFIISSIVVKSIGSNIAVTITALLILSIGVGFAFAGVFSKETVLFSQVKKYMMVPLTLTVVILIFKKFDIHMPVLQVALLFAINVLFFKNEIKKALKNQ